MGRRSAGETRALAEIAVAWISKQCSRQTSPIDDLDVGRKFNPDLRCERPYLTSTACCDVKDRATCVRHAHPLGAQAKLLPLQWGAGVKADRRPSRNSFCNEQWKCKKTCAYMHPALQAESVEAERNVGNCS